MKAAASVRLATGLATRSRGLAGMRSVRTAALNAARRTWCAREAVAGARWSRVCAGSVWSRRS